ncbi:hypothetical protein FLONG3_7869 [Fusarium longipes]|uniref:Uncharacterized protein n=1 Tax=Fusarium longipes TaxID=694270 RepID=A0A395S9Z7_9HYPO|nr:hypothetical protein FLONG3_7869 [Fusarium longipes]
MANSATMSPTCSITAYRLSVKVHNLTSFVYRLHHDFPVLDWSPTGSGPITLPFNLPSRGFMQCLDENLSEVSNELESFLSNPSNVEYRAWGKDLDRRFEALESAFEAIHTKVLKLDPVRLDEALVQFGVADDYLNSALEPLLFGEEDAY